MLTEFLVNLGHNLFKPLLLFFYAGFLIPVLGVKFEYPKALYRSLVVYLLLAIGWHGGEELASLNPGMIGHALGFMVLGFFTNLAIGFITYFTLRAITRLRKIDAATVAGYYGSDSAGTFVTCVGVLAAAQISFAPYMPVLLAVMEIPGCLVALFLVSKMRQNGMDAAGNMPGEVSYQGTGTAPATAATTAAHQEPETSEFDLEESDPVPATFESELNSDQVSFATEAERVLCGAGAGTVSGSGGSSHGGTQGRTPHQRSNGGNQGVSSGEEEYYDSTASNHDDDDESSKASNRVTHPQTLQYLAELESRYGVETDQTAAVPSKLKVKPAVLPAQLAQVSRRGHTGGHATGHDAPAAGKKAHTSNAELLKEVFLNPGLYLLFAGIAIGFIGRLQGEKVVAQGDQLFITLFQGVLCLFLLEMGMMAAEKLRDLRSAGWRFVAFGLLAPNLFAMIGIAGVHAYSWLIGTPFDVGTYVLFSVLCAAASYIALPAVQTLAIPEASPTLPLAASLGLTFTYNVTIGIQVYILVTKQLLAWWPIGTL